MSQVNKKVSDINAPNLCDQERINIVEETTKSIKIIEEVWSSLQQNENEKNQIIQNPEQGRQNIEHIVYLLIQSYKGFLVKNLNSIDKNDKSYKNFKKQLRKINRIEKVLEPKDGSEIQQLLKGFLDYAYYFFRFLHIF